MGVWGLGIGPNPQSPIPNPQSPIPNLFFVNYILILKQKILHKKVILLLI